MPSFFFLMIRRPPRSTLFPYTNALPICRADDHARPAPGAALCRPRGGDGARATGGDRKSTRLNSSHLVISYAVFCLKKKKLKALNAYASSVGTFGITCPNS